MAESRDPAIKLFGKTIKLPQAEESPVDAGEEKGGYEVKAASNKEANSDSKDKIEEAPSFIEEEQSDEEYKNEEKADRNALFPVKNIKADEQQNESNKKPEKILPCPRCKSKDTKFCYYNNYNANQPRHFCKKCQRYWTAGGSMRNVPVGAGRRKNKSSVASRHYHHLTVPKCVRSGHPESIHHLGPLKPNGTVLSFNSDSPLCKSMASVMNHVYKIVKDHKQDGLHRDLHEEQSSGSSVTASSSNEEGNRAANSNCHGFPPNVPYFKGTTFPYPWSQNSPFCTGRIPIPFYSMTEYWGMSSPSQCLSTCPSSGSSCSGHKSPNLGKHSREGNMLNNRTSYKGVSPTPDKSLWIPKTSSIDDPAERSKCSLWTSMRFKIDKADLINRSGGLFKAFQTNRHIETHPTEVSTLFHGNLSRSICYPESS